jgi:hypothetical protein
MARVNGYYNGEREGPTRADIREKLGFMTKSQLEIMDNKELKLNEHILHDLRGIYYQDKHFLPRIKALQKVVPYLT